MENKDIIKRLEKAIRKFDEQKLVAGAKLVREFYDELINQQNMYYELCNKEYDALVNSLVIDEEINTSKVQRRIRASYVNACSYIDKLLKQGYIVKDNDSKSMRAVKGMSKEEAEKQQLMERLSCSSGEAPLSEEEKAFLIEALSGDEFYQKIKDELVDGEVTSIIHLQRRYNIGFSRAGRIIDCLRAEGIIARNGSSAKQYVVKKV